MENSKKQQQQFRFKSKENLDQQNKYIEILQKQSQSQQQPYAQQFYQLQQKQSVENQSKKTSSSQDFEILRKLGQGSFGKVFKVKRIQDQQMYVLKQISIGHLSQAQKKKTLQEAHILNKVEHEYIVTYYDSFLEQDKLYIVMEYCDYGDLSSFMKSQMGRPIEEDKIWKILIQSFLGLEQIHKLNILHRDIKPQNIFLNSNLDIRIGDLGVAKTLESNSQYATSQVGTPYYMSPEVCKEQPYNEKSDIWSLGVVLYELATFKNPFESVNQTGLAYRIMQSQQKPISSLYSQDLQSVIESCLIKNHKNRISIQEILLLPAVIRKANQFKIDLNINKKVIKNNIKNQVYKNLIQNTFNYQQQNNILKTEDNGDDQQQLNQNSSSQKKNVILPQLNNSNQTSPKQSQSKFYVNRQKTIIASDQNQNQSFNSKIKVNNRYHQISNQKISTSKDLNELQANDMPTTMFLSQQNDGISYNKQIEKILFQQKEIDKKKNTFLQVKIKQSDTVENTPKQNSGIPYSKSLNPFKVRKIHKIKPINSNNNNLINNNNQNNQNRRYSIKGKNKTIVLNSESNTDSNDNSVSIIRGSYTIHHSIQKKKSNQNMNQFSDYLTNKKSTDNLQVEQNQIVNNQQGNQEYQQILIMKQNKEIQLQNIVRFTRNEMGRIDYLNIYNTFKDKLKQGKKNISLMDQIELEAILQEMQEKYNQNPTVVSNMFKIITLENDLELIDRRITNKLKNHQQSQQQNQNSSNKKIQNSNQEQILKMTSSTFKRHRIQNPKK